MPTKQTILNVGGKPIQSRDQYVVEINVYHKPKYNGGGRKIQILRAEVDGNLTIISSVLTAAMQKTIDVLIKIGAIKK